MDRKNIKVLGSKDYNGGIYGNILIMGSGDMLGDVECLSYKVFGSGDVKGNLKSEIVRINGSGDVYGDVEAEDIIINGSGDIHGDVRCGMMKIAGSGDVYKDVYAREVSLYGCSDIKGNCETEFFRGTGAFDIHGCLNAEEVDIEIAGRCSIKEIGGGKVVVKEAKKVLGKKIGLKMSSMVRRKRLECDLIEADEIYLESTSAKIVRGKNIIIGENCNIEFIEYVGECDINKDSDVGSSQKLLK